MLTYVLMLAFVIFIAGSTSYGIKFDKEKDSFMSIDDTNFLRGFWCIIVVLVHIPAAYQNRIQDIMGSFAYIGVTFFFMTSAYGLKYSMIHKKGYMECFWRRRLPAILIPALLANAFEVIIRGMRNGFGEISFISFFNINEWVKVLLLYYVAFWIIYYIAPQLGGYWQDISMCFFVVISSLIDRFTVLKITSRWIVEPLGFAYGIIAANYSDSIRKWIKEKWIMKCGMFTVLSGFLGIMYLRLKFVTFLGDYILKIVLGIAITALIFEEMAKLRVGNKLNSFLGEISYEIYLLHHGVFAFLEMMNKDMNSGAFVITAVVTTVALAYVFNRVCKQIVKLF